MPRTSRSHEGRLPETYRRRSGGRRFWRRCASRDGSGLQSAAQAAPGRCGARGRGTYPRTRAAPGLRPGPLWVPARSWLTAGRPAWRSRGQSAARRRDENAACGAPRGDSPPRTRGGHASQACRAASPAAQRGLASPCVSRRSAPLVGESRRRRQAYPGPRQRIGAVTHVPLARRSPQGEGGASTRSRGDDACLIGRRPPREVDPAWCRY